MFMKKIHLACRKASKISSLKLIVNNFNEKGGVEMGVHVGEVKDN